jgi:hypothetical protein
VQIVTFDYVGWTTRYPEMIGVAQAQATLFFNESTLYLANDGSGPISDPVRLGMVLNMLTAHIAFLADPKRELVGRISNASEGSVSVAAVMDQIPGTAAWFMQTRYGAAAWQALAQHRTMRYFTPWQ